MDSDRSELEETATAEKVTSLAAGAGGIAGEPVLCFRRPSENQTCVKKHAVFSPSVQAKCDFLKTLVFNSLTESPESPAAAEIPVIISYDVTAYLKCIDFMNRPLGFAVGSVSEALEVLLVSAEWALEECIGHCLNYLAAAPWSVPEKLRIRQVVERLQIMPPPDLGARLGRSDVSASASSSASSASASASSDDCCEHLRILEKSLRDLSCLSLRVRDPRENKLANLFESFVWQCFREDPDSDITRSCRNAVVNSFKFNMGCIVQGSKVNEAWVALDWLFGLSLRCDPSLLCRTLIEIFATEDKPLAFPSPVNNIDDDFHHFHYHDHEDVAAAARNSGSVSVGGDHADVPMLHFMNFHESILRCLAQARPVTDRLVRVLFLKKRISAMADVVRGYYDSSSDGKMLELTKLIIQTARTLPFEDIIVVFNILKHAAATNNFLSDNECTCEMFQWWIQELKSAHRSCKLLPAFSILSVNSAKFVTSAAHQIHDADADDDDHHHD